ncbi:Protein Networked [Sesbania bispinosa]|nr:Protein Networked [Sesbania bispinosa]
MSRSKSMIKRHFRELSKSFGSQIDPEKSEQLKRTKTDIENNLSRIQTLIKSEDQSRKEGNSRKETELLGLIEDFYNQYQSLYTQYGRLTGEYVKAVPRRVERMPSVSSSSSESEYFSSEDVDGNSEANDSNQKPFFRERERSAFANTYEVLNLKTRASTEAKEFEEQLTSQTKELVVSLNHQKRNLELQAESQAHEIKQLGAKNAELHARVLELELMLKESKGTLKDSKVAVSALQAKLKSNEDQATTKIADLMGRINKLEQEVKSLRTQKGKMEEKVKRSRNEALSQRKDLTDQLNVMQQNLDSESKQKKELETQLEQEREKVSQYLDRVENLEQNLAEKASVEQSLVKENECFLVRIKDLELEVESRCSKQHDLEERLRDTRCEINRLADEGKTLQDRNHELESAMTQREEEISVLLRKQESSKNVASTQTEVDDLRLELGTLQEQKSKLELQIEQIQKEYLESLSKLETQVADKEETIKKQTETINQIHAQNKQDMIWSNKLKSYKQFTERKMEELAEEFRSKIEDNIRLLHQRIHIAEQLNNENKDRHKMTKLRYEQEIASYEDEIRMLKASGTLSAVEVEVDLNGLDLAAGKIEEHRKYVMGLVSKMLVEVQFAKDWIKKRNGEMKEMKDKVDNLEELLGYKEEQELMLRERVWKLEADVSKEGGEKLNLMRVVSQLERKVGKLEKNLKEKDEELVSLGEKKREAIRQLCFLIEFHRDRCVYLKDLMSKSKTRVRNTT